MTHDWFASTAPLLMLIAAGCATPERQPPCEAIPTAAVAAPKSSAVAEQSNAGLDFLRSLGGNWNVVDSGRSSKASFEVIAGGTAVLQKSGFVAIYHLDGEEIKLLLFPDDGYQATMRSKGLIPATKTNEVHFFFDFAGATNMPSDAGRPTRVAFTKTDNDHFAQTWSWRGPARDSTFTLSFERVKEPPKPEP